MKKLKKGLSLLLVLAMVFSLASTAFAAWSTDYEDDDQINQKEAVAVMSAMGIIEGDNGKFDPDGQFTREQAAKIVTYMILGADTAESLQITTNKFSDVSASRWSAKYIAYAANLEIVMGDGNGKFRPADDVSRIEWLKMLLVSLGLDPDENGLGDDPNWATNTQSLAVRSGLVSGKELALDWNRETAVLYAFNAMQKAQDKTWQLNYVYTGDSKDFKFVRQYAPTLVASTATDVYGREYKTWTNGKSGAEHETYAESDTLLASYENKVVKFEDIEDDIDLLAGNEGLFQVYVDGTKVADTSGYDKDTEFGGRGSVVEVYKHNPADDKDTAQYRIVVINTYVAVVGDIKPDSDTVELTYKIGYNQSTSKDITATAKAAVADLAKGDIVSFNVGAVSKKVSAYNVTKLTGTAVKVTAYGNTGMPTNENYVRIDGEQVFASKYQSKAADNEATVFTAIKTATVYYDSYGNILYYTDSTDTIARSVDGYVLVVASESKAGDATKLLGAAPEAKAQIVDLETGKTSVVDRAYMLDGTTYKYTTKTGAAGAEVKNATSDALTAGFYAYYLTDDGKYIFEDASATAAVLSVKAGTDGTQLATNDVIVNKGQAQVGNFTGAFADANTKVTTIDKVGSTGTYKASTVTGIANYNKIQAKSTTQALVIYSNKKVSNVVIYNSGTTDAAVVDTNTYGMLKSQNDIPTDDNGVKTYKYTFVVNGQDVEYTSTTDLNFATNQNKVYEISEANGIVTFNPVTAEYSKATVTLVTDTYIVVNDTYVIYKDANNYHETDVSRAHEGVVKGATVTTYKSTFAGNTANTAYVVVVDPT
jgi:hypothetical protein